MDFAVDELQPTRDVVQFLSWDLRMWCAIRSVNPFPFNVVFAIGVYTVDCSMPFNEVERRRRDANKIVKIYDLPCKSRTTKKYGNCSANSAILQFIIITEREPIKTEITGRYALIFTLHAFNSFVMYMLFILSSFQQFSFFVSARSMQQIHTVKRTHKARSIFQLYISFVVCFFSHGISHLARQCVKRRNSNGIAALNCATHELIRVHENNMPHTDAALALTGCPTWICNETRVKRRWWICHQLTKKCFNCIRSVAEATYRHCKRQRAEQSHVETRDKKQIRKERGKEIAYLTNKCCCLKSLNLW